MNIIPRKFVKYPADPACDLLSHAQRTIFIKLLQQHFQKCGGDYDLEFTISDNELKSLSNCSSCTITKAKKRLIELDLIQYRIKLNKTIYKIS